MPSLIGRSAPGLAGFEDTAPAAASPAVDGRDRVVGIDAGRALGVVAVILIHTVATRPLGFGIDAERVIDQLCRWAVPFYFVASGYLLSRRIDAPPAATLRMIGLRLGAVFLAWSLIYLVPLRGGLSEMRAPDFLWRWLVGGGPAWHLWFLPSLATCLVTLVLLRRWRINPAAMTALGLVLYGAGLGLGAYRRAFVATVFEPISSSAGPPLLDGRGGPFPLIFVVAGFWIARAGHRLPSWLGPALLLGGAFLHLAEAGVLDALGWFPFARNDFLIGTLAFGIGAFLVAREARASPVARCLARLGPWSLGVYCCHVLFIGPIRRLLPLHDLTGNLLLAGLVLVASATAVAGLARLRALRPLLT